jgi:hypothetical protein
MAVKKTSEGYKILCDADLCDKRLFAESPSHEWKDVLQEMRDNDWKTKKEVDGQWMHLCSHCKNDY